MTTRKKIRDYILENFLFTADESALADEASFLQEGIVDSTGIMEVIAFLKQELGVDVADEEMVPENLDSVRNLVAYIARKQTN